MSCSFSVDDDQSIRHLAKGSIRGRKCKITKLSSIVTPLFGRLWIHYFKLNSEREQALFLIDYEFFDQSLNGLEIIQVDQCNPFLSQTHQPDLKLKINARILSEIST